MRKVLLKAKSNQRSALKVSGVATNMTPPLVGDVIVQLTARDAAPARCWSTAFTAPQINTAPQVGKPGRYSAELP